MLDQACAHCPIFPTAASRRSLGRVSVPVWLIVLSDQLSIVGLVGLYPTNYLIERRLLQRRPKALGLNPYAVLAPVSRRYPPPLDTSLRVTHPSAAEGRSPPHDLHVLSMPPAFTLSQDQTLKFITNLPSKPKSPPKQARITHLNPRSHTQSSPTLPPNPAPAPSNHDAKNATARTPAAHPTPKAPHPRQNAPAQHPKSSNTPRQIQPNRSNQTRNFLSSRKPDAIFNQHSEPSNRSGRSRQEDFSVRPVTTRRTARRLLGI